MCAIFEAHRYEESLQLVLIMESFRGCVLESIASRRRSKLFESWGTPDEPLEHPHITRKIKLISEKMLRC